LLVEIATLPSASFRAIYDYLARKAADAGKRKIPIKKVVIGLQGYVLQEERT
jgi:hypothetical protein